MTNLDSASRESDRSAGVYADGQVSGYGERRRYLTREGDTLEAVAEHFYGDRGSLRRLMEANPLIGSWMIGFPFPAGVPLTVPEHGLDEMAAT